MTKHRNDPTGMVLQGTYRIERLLGEGGAGAVYEVSHLRLSRRFAVKLLIESMAQQPAALARFHREAKVTSAIGHPHILEVIDFNHMEDGTPYIVMEMLEGEDLAQRIARCRQLRLLDAVTIVRQAASALHAAHKQGVIHRDLKPQNIFLCSREGGDFVKIFDFGISKIIGSLTALTKPQAMLGTPRYMSPEQAQGRQKEVGRHTDVYALGVILYEMLAGRPPFVEEGIPALLHKVVCGTAPALDAIRPDVPLPVVGAVARAMDKDWQARPATMARMWRELAQALDDAQTVPLDQRAGLLADLNGKASPRAR